MLVTKVQVVDQTVYPAFIEYSVRVNDTINFRIQADGTLTSLQNGINTKLNTLATPALISQVNTGDLISISPITIGITPS